MTRSRVLKGIAGAAGLSLLAAGVNSQRSHRKRVLSPTLPNGKKKRGGPFRGFTPSFNRRQAKFDRRVEFGEIKLNNFGEIIRGKNGKPIRAVRLPKRQNKRQLKTQPSTTRR